MQYVKYEIRRPEDKNNLCALLLEKSSDNLAEVIVIEKNPEFLLSVFH